MDNIIDLADERDKRDGPDPECRTTDQYGRPMFMFSFDYRYENKDYSLSFWAYDQADAEARIAALKETAEYSGQIYSIIPA